MSATTPKYLRWDNFENWTGHGWLGFVFLLSGLFALALRTIWPTDWILDDGAIVLRYMDMFAKGGWYQYNLEDPPVFGVSGFVHATLSGLLAASHIVSPDESVLISNTLGVALTSVALLLLLRLYTSSVVTSVLAWAFCMTASHFFIQTAFQGLEAPLHLGITLLAFWAFVAQRSRTMWLCFALAVISKLDAAPVVAVLGLLRIWQGTRASAEPRTWLEELRRAIVWAGIPLAAWVLLTIWLFGSPFPQSAYAKLNFHHHPPSRYAFFQYWWRVDHHFLTGHAIGLLLLPLAGFLRSAPSMKRAAPYVLALCCAVLLALYSYYNPSERMRWYYVLPQTLLVLGALIGFLEVCGLLASRSWLLGCLLAIAAFATLMPSYWNRTLEASRYMIAHTRSTEPERAAVGEWIRDNSGPEDRLYTGHGYIARAAGIYTFDYSGLNSPIVTRLISEGKSPLSELQPEWSVRPGLWPPTAQANGGWELRASFYGRSCDGRTAWRVFRQTGTESDEAIVARALVADEVKGADSVQQLGSGELHIRAHQELHFTCIPPGFVHEFRAGIAKTSESIGLEMHLVVEGGEPTLLSNAVVPATDATNYAFGRAQEIRVELPPSVASSETAFELRVTRIDDVSSAAGFRVLEPIWMVAVDR